MISFSLAVMGLPAGSELWIIGGVVLLLFGGAKIPQLMRGLGRGVGELKVGLEEGKKAFTEASSDDDKKDDKKGE